METKERLEQIEKNWLGDLPINITFEDIAWLISTVKEQQKEIVLLSENLHISDSQLQQANATIERYEKAFKEIDHWYGDHGAVGHMVKEALEGETNE
ncbi:hypothetical protein SAMN05877753_1062 [Bacillus oleivorans]|uniref:Uncharacterized protein n=1 Tax=Bacillus oleivorans TaxID=1448271 RepID=A0A285CXW4_9BACI|nr:hypothetical protein [Bacillus oleivorans]SNX72255.1 hypothetical protein SAMN05877753_1062 [Bacillus oleivorans]